jgi:hypothetical protein
VEIKKSKAVSQPGHLICERPSHGIIFVLTKAENKLFISQPWHQNLVMLNLRKPAFIFAIIGVLLFFIGIYLQQKQNYGSNWLIYIGLTMGVIYWIWSVIDVLKADDLKPYQKKFWLILVLVVPAFGGALFHIMHQSRNKIVT